MRSALNWQGWLRRHDCFGIIANGGKIKRAETRLARTSRAGRITAKFAPPDCSDLILPEPVMTGHLNYRQSRLQV
ncbi:MAG: hypothetical protein LBM77_06355 [Spirochaetaceae bacterium]|nr:hypothetical protein [Spirochaetaceae bacterium]